MSRPNLYIFDDPAVDRHRLLLQAQLFRDYVVQHAPAFVPTPPRRILDLGCGVGDLSVVFRVLYPEAELVGIDRNAEALTTARQQPGLDHKASFVVGDIQDALPPGPFDLVYASVVLLHVRDLARVVNLVADALAPGGTFWIKEAHPDAVAHATEPDYKFMAETFYTTMQKAGGHPYVGAEVLPLLTAAGFADIRVADDEIYQMGGDTIEGESCMADLIAATRNAGPMLSRMTGIPADEILGRANRLLAAAQASTEAIGTTVFRNITARRLPLT
jgi:trans-aconitate methyltransferase